MKIIPQALAFLIVLLPVSLCAQSKPTFKFDFTESNAGADGIIPNAANADMPGLMKGSAETATTDVPKVLLLDAKNEFVEIQGSEGLAIGPEGLTILATVKFADNGTVMGEANAHDMIVFKDDSFLLGRMRDQIYVNTYNKNTYEWSKGGVTGGKLPFDEWCRVAAVFEPITDDPSGKCTVRGYVNGKLVVDTQTEGLGVSDAPVNIGKGWGGVWFFHGQMADVTIYNRVLYPDELEDFFLNPLPGE